MVKQSLTRVVQGVIESDNFIQESLERGYVNISALARLLKPRVEEIIGEKVNINGIITAIRRARLKLRTLRRDYVNVIANSVITIKTNLAKISIEKTRRNLERARILSTEFPEVIFQVLEGIETLTLIVDQRIYNEIKMKFRKDEIISEKLNLAAIVIQSPREIIETPGCIAEFYNALARKGINVEETVSCSTETIIVVGMEDSIKAYNALISLIGEFRRKVSVLKALKSN
ncbi:MAG: hypothetical protein QXH24_02820 [Candidatus Bathyarchaeia archaeon]